MGLSAATTLDGKYRLVRELGRGAMGSVWEAEHLVTERRVAVKVIVEGQQTPETKARMLREGRACGRVENPHVVQILDAGQTEDGWPYLVMELLDGQSLDGRLADAGKLGQAEATAIALDVARGLAAVHRLGVVHRDLKPANIYLHRTSNGERVVKVVDFGISKLESANDLGKTDTGKVVGSPAYMSPEQAQGLPNIDLRTDVWSLGVVLFEMLAGELPFAGETPWAVVAEIIRGDTPVIGPRLEGVDSRVVELIERCLVRDRARRLASADDVVSALEEITGDVEKRSRPPATVARTSQDLIVDPNAATLEERALDIRRTSGAAALSSPTVTIATRRPRAILLIGGAAVVTLLGLGALAMRTRPAADGLASAPPETSHAPMPRTQASSSAEMPRIEPTPDAASVTTISSPELSAQMSATASARANTRRTPREAGRASATALPTTSAPAKNPRPPSAPLGLPDNPG